MRRRRRRQPGIQHNANVTAGPNASVELERIRSSSDLNIGAGNRSSVHAVRATLENGEMEEPMEEKSTIRVIIFK